jgi:hypothetical protein
MGVQAHGGLVDAADPFGQVADLHRARITGGGLTPPLSNAAASETYVTGIPDWLRQLLQLDDTLPTLAADPDTIRDAIKAVGEDNQATGERQRS